MLNNASLFGVFETGAFLQLSDVGPLILALIKHIEKPFTSACGFSFKKKKKDHFLKKKKIISYLFGSFQ